MSSDAGGVARANSPASSDSSLTRLRARGNNDEHLKKDKQYRRYAASVERALSLFDTALQEWADYISFLSRLLKALQSHPPEHPVVPHKILVAKRLAQCMNPSLPSGVHQKALEVYTYIFGLIKPSGLSQDLPLYFPGVAPTLTFASLSVRPLFINLIETFFPELDPAALRPALKGIILALLPGLEEETSEDFEPALRTLNKIRNVVNQLETQQHGLEEKASGQYFWQCLFLASITNPSRRMGVLAYLNRHLPKLGIIDVKAALSGKANENAHDNSFAIAESIISPEPGLLVRCFASGLADEQLLVQRNFLDLLVTHLPLHSPILQSRISRDDFERLVVAAAGVVTRRDMSLNRRLWAWFLGPESPTTAAESLPLGPDKDATDHSQSQYLNKFGLDPLVRGLLKMLNQKPVLPTERSKPIRIAVSLMDRWEVGGFVVPAVFLPIMKNVQEYEITAPKHHFDEVFRSSSAFFDGVESTLIFSEILYLIDVDIDNIHNGSDKKLNNLKLAHFILAKFNVREEEMLLIHIPLLILSMLSKTNRAVSKYSQPNPAARKAVVQQYIKLLVLLVSLVPERAFYRRPSSESSPANQVVDDNADVLKKVHDFYDRSKESPDLPFLPFPPKVLAEYVLREAHSLCMSALDGNDDELSVREVLGLFTALLKKTPKSDILADNALLGAFYRSLEACHSTDLDSHTFSIISSIAWTVTAMHNMHVQGHYITYDQVNDLLPVLVKHLWAFLSAKCPKFHVETVRCLWSLHSISWQDHLVEAAITSLMVGASGSGRYRVVDLENAERFFVLWNHSHNRTYDSTSTRTTEDAVSGKAPGHERILYQTSLLERPLFLVLDLLSNDADEISQSVRDWISDLSSIHRILYIVITRLEALLVPQPSPPQADATSSCVLDDDLQQCQYLLETISKIISCLSHRGWITLVTHPVSPDEKPGEITREDEPELKTFQTALVDTLFAVLKSDPNKELSADNVTLQRTSLLVLRQLLSGLGAEQLIDNDIHLTLLEKLSVALDQGSHSVQSSIIDTLIPALKARFASVLQPPQHMRAKDKKLTSRETLKRASLLSLSTDRVDKMQQQQTPTLPRPPEQLLNCLLRGLSSPNSHGCLDKWILLLSESLPLYAGGIFQILLVLVECLCREIRQSFAKVQAVFKATKNWPQDRSEFVTVALLTGLEACIAAAHERLHVEEANTPASKSPDQPQGFFGNMVSGVFSNEGPSGRNAANDRLTVLLCFQDAVRLCFSIWCWGASKNWPSLDSESAASFQYTSLRMRNRSRRLLEHLFAAEALECLETLVEIWAKLDPSKTSVAAHVFNLLHTLDRARPKVTIPAIFNGIYSRTNPTALEPSRKSALASNITESDLAAFLVTYARSLDDDVLDEIWTDCVTFLKDVLANPFPHRQILSRLIEFAAILGAKMDNTGFGDDRRMRKELGDLLIRLLTAIFTSKPLGFSQESTLSGRAMSDQDGIPASHAGPDDMLTILNNSLPAFLTTLGETDRITSAVSNISTNVIVPILRSRLFPNNVNRNFLSLLQQISKISTSSKVWKKDINEAFNDARFFGMHVDLVKSGWMGLLQQWILVDKERFPELLSRLTPPASAGIMFGVGASAARLEADRKTQLNLRRIALLILSTGHEHIVADLPTLMQKLEDLLQATNVSSPSSLTRAEIFMVLRALVVKTSSTTHLAPFWPLITNELQDAICAVPNHQTTDLYNPYSLLQACKLLDTLLLLAPDDFQLQEWLFVTDTIDAIHPPSGLGRIAQADEVSQAFGPSSLAAGIPSPHGPGSPAAAENFNDFGSDTASGLKKPLLTSDRIRETAKDEIVERVLRPFFDRLSIFAFESTYSMALPDTEACIDDLLADLFNEGTMAS